MTERHDVWRLADAIQQDLRAAQAKMVELRAQLAALEIPDATRTPCLRCHLIFPGPAALAEHAYQMHDGPEPQAWRDAEALAAG